MGNGYSDRYERGYGDRGADIEEKRRRGEERKDVANGGGDGRG